MTKRTKRIHCVVLVLSLLMCIAGCKYFDRSNSRSSSSSPSDPSAIPTSPGSSPSSPAVQLALPLSSEQPGHHGNFFADVGISDEVGVYYDGRSDFFQVQVPLGEYLLTYTTNLGMFYMVFQATESAIITVGIHEDDQVYEAMLYNGTVTDTSNGVEYPPVIVFSEFGAMDGWWNIFVKDDYSPGILLIGGIVGVAYTPGESLELTISRPGHYLLDYTTNLGIYQIDFWTTAWYETKIIPLQPGEEVWEAYITVL
jgi:hypothetical protein